MYKISEIVKVICKKVQSWIVQIYNTGNILDSRISERAKIVN